MHYFYYLHTKDFLYLMEHFGEEKEVDGGKSFTTNEKNKKKSLKGGRKAVVEQWKLLEGEERWW